MEIEWEKIESLRRNKSADFDNAKQIDELLAQLAAQGDLDAIAQQCIDRINTEYEVDEITMCEAFARALECLAKGVLDRPLHGNILDGEVKRFRGKEFLALAWNYLVEDHDQDDFVGVASPEGKNRRQKGGYAPPAWTNSHSAHDAGPCSGWIQPRQDDPEKDRSARIAHFLINSILTYRGGSLGSGARAWRDRSEPSTTDKEVNRIGNEFGKLLKRGEINSGNIADWIRKNLCTEKVEMTLYWETKKGPGTEWWNVWAVDAKSEYHNTHFVLSWMCSGSKHNEEWDAFVFYQGGTGYLGKNGIRDFDVNLGEHPTREDLVEWAKSESGLDFRAPPAPD